MDRVQTRWVQRRLWRFDARGQSLEVVVRSRRGKRVKRLRDRVFGLAAAQRASDGGGLIDRSAHAESGQDSVPPSIREVEHRLQADASAHRKAEQVGSPHVQVIQQPANV